FSFLFPYTTLFRSLLFAPLPVYCCQYSSSIVYFDVNRCPSGSNLPNKVVQYFVGNLLVKDLSISEGNKIHFERLQLYESTIRFVTKCDSIEIWKSRYWTDRSQLREDVSARIMPLGIFIRTSKQFG